MNTPNSESTDEFKLLKSIQLLLLKFKRKPEINENDNILIKYLKNKEIIKNNKSENLLLFIKELIKQIKRGNNIIIPFIDPCYNLIEAYVNNNINKDQINNFNEIFHLLIENSFINRKVLIPIYAYFTELYSDVEKIKELDDKLINFSKISELWNLFYSYRPKKFNYNSSFCFLGTGLELYGIENIPKNINFKIKINFMKSLNFKYLNANDDLIGTEEINIKYLKLLEYKNEEISSLELYFKYIKKDILIEISICNKKATINKISLKININTKKINILNNFFGQINSIDISLYEESNKKIYSEEISPIPLKDNGGIIFSSEYKFNFINFYSIHMDNSEVVSEAISENQSNNNSNNLKIKIKIKNIELAKINYINYKEKSLNIIDYFGGIIQFLPFINIINGLYRNEKIQIINKIEKVKVLNEFTRNILIVIIKYLKNPEIKIHDYMKKYWSFNLYILNKIPINFHINLNEFLANTEFNNNIIYKIFKVYFKNINHNENHELENKIKECINKIYSDKKINNNDNLNIIGKTNNQLYRNTIKELFVYNRLWSKQYLYFKNVNDCYKNGKKNLKIKYKRINYYPANFQQP